MANVVIVYEKIHKSPEFLRFAKSLGGECCVCRYTKGDHVRAEELHHYGEKGTGQRANDHLVGRVCIPCHRSIQGKRRLAFLSMDRLDILEALEADSLQILSQWARRLEAMKKPAERCYRCSVCDYHAGDGCLAVMAHEEPPRDCAREEALAKALDVSPDDVDGFMDWAITWANKRSADVIGDLADALREIASDSTAGESARFSATVALKRARLDSVEK